MSTFSDAAWAALCDELVEVEHQLWRASLPAGYQPLQRDWATFHSLPLEMSAAEHADLLARRQALCLQAARLSAEHQRVAHGITATEEVGAIEQRAGLLILRSGDHETVIDLDTWLHQVLSELRSPTDKS